ncbi:hypothetical protein D0962_31195 [Leptolyngbyaceae cyanobacterium CCMR0082]|uniref:Uncharacterized protein n=2 Tax=Adonisia turfae TaxID=2950184 RepID=A0A6M0SFB6_9CYAN|nr:hypothetical protein [Adonisia turfae CCMR0081]NEZ67169.1 hypothetical protein [Adonisia turfae CCMR0082]
MAIGIVNAIYSAKLQCDFVLSYKTQTVNDDIQTNNLDKSANKISILLFTHRNRLFSVKTLQTM